MTLRRSSRRLTITGSTVFSASTPMVPPPIEENIDFDGSPNWVSAEDAFGAIKTPKFTQVTRRSTMTRQNIFQKENATAELSGKNKSKPPSFFIPVSPPGVKTRSRRSSIITSRQSISKQDVNLIKKKSQSAKTSENNVEKTTVQTNHKSQLQKIMEKEVSVKNASGFKRPADKQSEEKKVSQDNGKKPKRLTRKTLDQTSLEKELEEIKPTNFKEISKETENENNMQAENAIVIKEKNEVMTPVVSIQRTPLKSQSKSLRISSKVEFESVRSVQNEIYETPKTVNSSNPVETISLNRDVSPPVTKSARNAPKSKSPFDSINTQQEKIDPKLKSGISTTMSKTPSTELKKRKRLISKEEEEVEEVVKKMFTPSSSNSVKNVKNQQSKMYSPNADKANASPARVALIKNSEQNKMQRADILWTPSRAAAKARKILGVSTPCNASKNAHVSSAPEENSPLSEIDSVSNEDTDLNITLSHTSHSQWCTIL